MNQEFPYSLEIQERLLHLIDSINAIPGKKMLVLLAEKSQTPEIQELSEDEPLQFNEHSFCQKLGATLNERGSLMIRQFLHLKVEFEDFKGNRHWIPIKRLYGVALGEEKWIPISATDMKIVYTTDMTTGRPLPIEPDIVFGEIPVA